MNGHPERVRTACNVAVQLVGDVRPDLPDSTRTARQLLLTDPGGVTESDRETLHAFFRARIGEAKGSDTAARELPGIAVHQLLTDGDDAVTSARFVWNGTGMDEG